MIVPAAAFYAPVVFAEELVRVASERYRAQQ